MRPFVLAMALSVSTSAFSASTAPEPIVIDSTPAPFVIDVPRAPVDGMTVVDPDGPLRRICPATSRYEAARRGGKLPPSLLSQLPAADMYNAVYRRIDGCQVPMVVRYDVGGSHR